jgi:hypothetical protein
MDAETFVSYLDQLPIENVRENFEGLMCEALAIEEGEQRQGELDAAEQNNPQ